MKKRVICTSAVILVATLALTILAVGSQARVPVAEVVPWSKLAFQSYRDGNWEIYVQDSDGSDLLRLTQEIKADIQPRLNYDSTQIAFASDRSGNYEIYVMNVDGSGLARLTYNAASDVEPFWSPDRTQIVYESSQGGLGDIYVMNADGSGQVKLTSHAAYDGQPAWSPDGSRIAFVSKRTGHSHIWVMNTDGSDPVELSTQPDGENPAWSPDSGQIAYDADGDGDGWQELWLMGADGSDQQQIYDAGVVQTDSWARSWSPDGRYVGFTEIYFEWRLGQWQWMSAYLMAWDSTTGDAVGLPSSGDDWRPDWQTTDPWPPATSVQGLPVESSATFTVTWSGSDLGPSGLESYDVQVRDGQAGSWADWQISTTAASAAYTGLGGHTYYFRCRARDYAGNIEPWPLDDDAHTRVESDPPQTSVHPLPAYARSGLEIHWSGFDPGDSGIKGYDVQYRKAGGDWIDWQVDTLAILATFSETSGFTYDFRSRATDEAMNVENWPAGSGDASTTLYTWSISGAAFDNTHTPVEGATAGTTPAAFRSISSDDEGAYAAYVATESISYTVTWDADGFGQLPATAFPGADARLDVILPPAGDVVLNGGFEDAGAGWQAGGQFLPEIVSSPRHTGRQAAELGERFEFGPAGNVSNNAGDTYFGPAIAIDGDYTAHVLWSDDSQGYDHIYYATRPEGGAWSAPLTISGAQSEGPALAIDESNTIHAVWREFSPIVYAFKLKGGGWSSPTPVSVNYGYWPDIVIGGDGTLHVMWSGTDIMYSAKPVGGDWSAPIAVSRDNYYGGASQPKLAVDREDGLHAIWFQHTLTQWQIFYARKPHDGTWLTPVCLTSGGGWLPDIAVDAAGTLHAVWESLEPGNSGTMYATQHADEPWSTPVHPIPCSTDRPSIAAFGTGTVHLVCHRSEEILYTWKPPDGQWQPATSLFTGTSTYPQVAVDATGLPSTAWSGLAGGSLDTFVRTPRLAEQTGDSLLAQAVVVPDAESTPTLSFLHQPVGLSQGRGTRLSLQLDDGLAVTELFSTTAVSDAWIHQWFDLSPWASRPVTLTFRVHETATRPPAWAGVDEVSLGPTYPDVWVQQENSWLTAARGDQVTWTITFGNRGGAAAAGVWLTDTLPLGLSFVDASPPPQVVAPELVWDIGNLAAKGEPLTVVVTVTVAPTAPLFGQLTNMVFIQTMSPELQTANNLTQGVVWVVGQVYLPLAIKGQ